MIISAHNLVFVKDFPCYLRGRLSNLDFIPENYIHSFLIRDPRKSIPSYYKMCSSNYGTGENGNSWAMYMNRFLFNIHNFILNMTKVLGISQSNYVPGQLGIPPPN